MKWTKVTIETTTQATDMLSYYLSEYGVEGIEIEDKIPLSEQDKKAMFIDILPELPADDGVALISCYIDDNNEKYDDDKNINVINLKNLCRYIKDKLDEMSEYMDIGTGRISIGETEDKDWINNWKEFFHPFRLGDNIVIQPTWTDMAEDVNEDDIVIYIDPGTAFGTGSHETTKLCINSLKKYISNNDFCEILDAGCGSGILSIVAAKLGASRIYGVDIDELAVKASKDNLKINNINEEIYEIVKGDVINDPEFSGKVVVKGRYDIVVANILADIIIPLSKVVRSFMKPEGVFISSGIINTKENEVKNALVKNGFKILEIDHMGEWVSIVAC